MFFALIAKEIRILRPTIIAALLMSTVFYGVVLPAMMLTSKRPGSWPWDLSDLATLALVLGTTMAAICGGTTLPTERRERWADFAAMLPSTRALSAAARFVAGITVFGVIWGVHLLLLVIAERKIAVMSGPWTVPHWQIDQMLAFRHERAGSVVRFAAEASVAFFGIAWLIGSFARSVAAPAAGAVGLVLIGLVIVVQTASNQRLYEGPSVSIYMAAVAVVGIVAFIGGTAYLLRRVEP